MPAAGMVGKTLRIALFSGNYNCVVDGANRALNRLVARALSCGMEARVYSPTVPEPAFPPAGDLVPVWSVPVPGRAEYRFAPRLPESVASDVRHYAPSLIHVSAPDGLGAGAARLARKVRVPLVASVHTRFETYLEFYGLGALRGLVESWLRRFYGRCDMLLVPSEAVGEEMRASGIATPMRVWSRGVDRSLFDPSRRDMAWRRSQGIGDGEIALLFFGRVVPEKGLKPFAATVAALRAARLPVRPLVVGDGPGRADLAERLGGVVFTGHIEGAALARAVASSDIFLNPSVTEAFGNVTLEAMAAGVVVVAADVAANRALLEDRRTGRVVADRVEAYVEAIRGTCDSPGAWRSMVWHAGEKARRFSWPTTLDAVLDAYRYLAGPAAPAIGPDPAPLRWPERGR